MLTKTIVRQEIISLLLAKTPKEYWCHIQFVHKIGRQLAKQYKANPLVVELGCLLHDIGRDHEVDGEPHSEASVRIASKILSKYHLDEKIIALTLACIKNHNSISTGKTIEEKIVNSADGASKVLYHEAFMLLCKKLTYEDKLAWGRKYLEKGYQQVKIGAVKKRLKPKYDFVKSVYSQIDPS